MAYLEIVNGKIEGWRAPSYQWDAKEFVEEVEKVCVLKTTAIDLYDTSDGVVNADIAFYEHEDGSHFVVATDPDDGCLIEVKAMSSYDDDYDLIYRCDYYKKRETFTASTLEGKKALAISNAKSLLAFALEKLNTHSSEWNDDHQKELEDLVHNSMSNLHHAISLGKLLGSTKRGDSK